MSIYATVFGHKIASSEIAERDDDADVRIKTKDGAQFVFLMVPIDFARAIHAAVEGLKPEADVPACGALEDA